MSEFELRSSAILEILNSLRVESDRGAIIIAVSIIDDALKALIESKLPVSSATTTLFQRGGAADTVFGKLVLARALGLISSSERRDIQDITSIRNGAAHIAEEFTIDETIEALSERLIDNWMPHIRNMEPTDLAKVTAVNYITQASISMYSQLYARRRQVEQIQLRD